MSRVIRSCRRALALLVLAVLLPPLGTALPPCGTASAAEGAGTVFLGRSFSDVSGGQAYYFDLAATAGLIRGDGGLGGSCRPGASVTRAEFAVMVMRLLALDPAFQAPPAGPLPFSDAAEVPGWAVGAVGACAALGIVSGEPDGLGGYRFRPGGLVAGADALAMLLRALDNARDVTTWPTGFIYRAYETGLLRGEVLAGDWRFIQPLVPITRAQAAYVLTNALFCSRGFEPGPPGHEGTFTRSSIGGRLSGRGLVVAVDPSARSLSLSDGRVLTLAPTVVAPGVTAPGDLVGRRVFWLLRLQGDVGYLQVYSAAPPVTGGLESLELRPERAGVAAVRLDDGRVLRCAPGAVVELNGQRWPFDPATVLPDAEVTAIVEGGEAVYVSILQEDLPGAVIWRLGPTTGLVTCRLSLGQAEMTLEVTPETRIFLDGRPADLSELREWDVFYAATEPTFPKRVLRLHAYRSRLTATVVGLSQVYDSSGRHLRVVVEDAHGERTSLPVSLLCEDFITPDLEGRELTFCLGRQGEVVFFHVPGPAPGSPRVVKTLRTAVVRDRRLLTVDWQGSELTFELGATVGAPEDGVLVRLYVGADGRVVAAEPVAPPRFVATVVGYDPARGRLTLTTGGLTWSVSVWRVPVYAAGSSGASSGGERVLVGAAVPPEALAPGLTVLTGETGAGKSVVIDAVSAILGGKIGADFVRTGAEQAHVEAIFTVADSASGYAIAQLLAEHGVEIEEGSLILSRDVYRSGRTVARVNGRAVPHSLL
ncbi:MAG: S-layer homology domain-containing protein, partial [Firmicutes bacterium]|nr:S-layer homology domain-containing protein [Bacillota bacterium]